MLNIFVYTAGALSAAWMGSIVVNALRSRSVE